MLKKCTSLLIVSSLIYPMSVRLAYPREPNVNPISQQSAAQPTQEEKLKKRIVEWGTNKNVSVRLRSGEKLEGRIAEIRDNLFSIQIVNKGQITSREVSYGDVKKIQGKNESGAGKVIGLTAIGILAGVGAAVLILFLLYQNN